MERKIWLVVSKKRKGKETPHHQMGLSQSQKERKKLDNGKTRSKIVQSRSGKLRNSKGREDARSQSKVNYRGETRESGRRS